MKYQSLISIQAHQHLMLDFFKVSKLRNYLYVSLTFVSKTIVTQGHKADKHLY